MSEAPMYNMEDYSDLMNENVYENENEGNVDFEDAENMFKESEESPVQVNLPKKRTVRNPRPRLTVDTLRGDRGLQHLENYYMDIKYKTGKDSESKNLNEVMHRLQHWAHRMYPNFKFDDVLANIERLGKKKPLQVHMSRYRLGLLAQDAGDGKLQEEKDDDRIEGGTEDEPFDEFDALLGEQIALSKIVPTTPVSVAYKETADLSSSVHGTDLFNYTSGKKTNLQLTSLTTRPPSELNATNVPDIVPKTKLTNEQLSRIAENRRIAEERLRAKRLKLQSQQEL